MPKITAAEFREKHARNLKQSVEDIRRGVDRVSESPMEKAADAQEKMVARLMESVQSGKWAAGLKRVSLAEWKEKFKTKGIPRIAAGIDAAAAKVERFAGELLAYEETLQTTIDRMPDVTLEDSIARMNAWTRGMSEFKRSG